MMTAMLALTLNAFLDPSGLVRDLRADGNLLANEVRFHIAAPQWNGTWGMTGDTRTSRVTGRKLSPSGMIVTGEFNGGPKLLWQVEMRRKGDGIVYACRVKSARGIVPAGAVLIRVLVPNRIAIGRRVMCIFPHLVEERKFPTALERNYVLWRHSGFLALLWEGEGNKFLCIRPLKGVRYFQLQDNRRFKGDTFEAQFYADSALRDDRWVEIAVEFEAMDEANAMAMVKTVREAERSIATALHSSDRLRIHSVSVVTKEPRAFRKLEIRIDLSGTWNNPFDPNQIDVVAEIASPRGRAYRIPAFFYVPFERRRVGGTEALIVSGNPDFRVRLLPMRAGIHRVRIIARDCTGMKDERTIYVHVGSGEGHGFVRVDARDRTRLCFDDGTPLFLIGHNVCWLPTTFHYDEYFDRMSAAGENYARLWIGPFDLFTLERIRQSESDIAGLGIYDPRASWRLDYVIELAEQKGILLMLCIESFNSLRPAKFKYGMWERCPYNTANDGPCEHPKDFFTNEEAKRYFKRRLRYMVARWSYSPAVLSWEFWNEVDITHRYDSNAVAKWHAEMAQFLRQIDPYNHLITTSYATSHGDSAVDGLRELDYVQTHNYGAYDMAEMVEHWHEFKARYNKPHFVGEFGLSASSKPYATVDPEGIHLHNGIWAGLSCGDAGTAMLWWWDNYIHPRNLYHHFTAIAKFLKLVGVPAPPVRRMREDEIKFAYPKGTQFANMCIPTVPGSWQPAPWNKPNTVIVKHDGTVEPSGVVSNVIHGVVNHPKLHNPITFTLDCLTECEFAVHVERVSGHGGAGLIIEVDGAVVLKRDFDDPDGLKSTKDIYRYNGRYAVKLTRGKHTVKVENHGRDWFVASFEVTKYRTPLRAYGIKSANMLLIWVQHVQSTWWHIERGALPFAVDDAEIKVTARRGRYRIIIWDTWRGRTIREFKVSVVGNDLTITLPPIERDVAIAGVRL